MQPNSCPSNVQMAGCVTWRVEWGPGSPRPGRYMLYKRCGDCDEYIGTYLTIRSAMQETSRMEGCPLASGHEEYAGAGAREMSCEGSPGEEVPALDQDVWLRAAAWHEAGHATMAALTGRRRVKFLSIEPDGTGECAFHRQPAGTVWGPDLIEAFIRIDVAGSLAEGADPMTFDWRSLNEIDREVIEGEYQKLRKRYGEEPEGVIRRLIVETHDDLFHHALGVEALAEALVVRKYLPGVEVEAILGSEGIGPSGCEECGPDELLDCDECGAAICPCRTLVFDGVNFCSGCYEQAEAMGLIVESTGVRVVDRGLESTDYEDPIIIPFDPNAARRWRCN